VNQSNKTGYKYMQPTQSYERAVIGSSFTSDWMRTEVAPDF